MKNSKIVKLMIIALVAINTVACQSEAEERNEIALAMHHQNMMTSKQLSDKFMEAEAGDITHTDMLAFASKTLNRHESFINAAAIIKGRTEALDKQAEMMNLYGNRESFEDKVTNKVYGKVTNSMLYKMGKRHYDPDGVGVLPKGTKIYTIQK
jgi:hypothetical protein